MHITLTYGNVTVTLTHNHTASGAGAVMTPSTGLGLDGELSAPSSVGVGRHRWAKHTSQSQPPLRQKNAPQPLLINVNVSW